MDLKITSEELSSDEYSHEDDDDLMNVAVIKQKSPSPSSRPNVKPSEVSGNGVGQKKKIFAINRPPVSRAETLRRIRLLQQHNLYERPYLYFKRRSIKWLRNKTKHYNTYAEGLKIVMPISNLDKIFERIRKKNRQECRSRSMTRSYSRTPSRSRSRSRSFSRSQTLSRSRSHSPHSGSQSPELICLDDTENEESPEKLDPPRQDVVTPVKETKTRAISPPTHFEPREKPKAPPEHNENGAAELAEFLMLKDSHPKAKPTFGGENDYELVNLSAPMALEREIVNKSPIRESKQKQLEEDLLMAVDGTIKRRRSVTPPAKVIDKRSKPDSTEVLEDDDAPIQFLNVPEEDVVMKTHPGKPQMPKKESVPPAVNSDLASTQQSHPGFKLSTPYSLTLPAGNDQAVNMAAPSYSLNTPTPPAVPMEISYPPVKMPKITIHQGGPPMNLSHAQHLAYSYPKTHSPKLAPSHASKAQKKGHSQKGMPPASVHQANTPVQQVATTVHHVALPSHYIVHTQHIPSSPQLTQPPATPQLAPKQHPVPAANPPNFVAPQPPRRSETVSTQTQDPQPSRPRQRTSVDLNNSDANFHQQIKDLYTEMDSIMQERVKAVRPDFCSFLDERRRLDADLKTLDKLLAQKEDEYNRLLHLRCVKEELRGRLQRKEIVSVIKDMLPPLLTQSCGTLELQEIHSMLMDEENAPIPSKNGPSAIERCLSSMEKSHLNIKLLKGALGIKQQAPPLSIYQSEEQNSIQSNTNSLPGASQAPSRDIRDMEEDPPENSLEQAREKPPASKRAKLESELTMNSTTNLSQSSFLYNKLQSKAKALAQSHSSLDAHNFNNASTPKPLFNSSPMVNRQPAKGQQLDSSSSNRYEGDLSQANVSKSQTDTALKNARRVVDDSATMNGKNDKSCNHCGIPKVGYTCSCCQKQWYCSRDCQLRAWDSHWNKCKRV
ncbi:uncharacterized protein Dana_GF24275, isoform B [Drosophila ananassae]|uniref:Uncharacterized protein, isoform B n=1 Tax=Drosophila ananassae TaxID=7217 RepID=A0A0N8P0W1_DROAN|nr:uncharacterized protein LOC6506908 isoform X2 [Drosophila ananassae]KPU78228.1 uncharacterized protein Dana_GF24275, isoform B [Drosophila ananassae]